MSWRFIHVVVYITIYSFICWINIPLYVCATFYLSFHRNLNCFYPLTIVNNATLNMNVQRFVHVPVTYIFSEVNCWIIWVTLFFFSLFGSGDWTSSLAHARQGLYHWAIVPALGFWDRVLLCSSGWYWTQIGFKLAILLPPPPKCWDYRCLPPFLAPYFSFFKEWSEGKF
jgi:hypothetical protein